MHHKDHPPGSIRRYRGFLPPAEVIVLTSRADDATIAVLDGPDDEHVDQAPDITAKESRMGTSDIRRQTAAMISDRDDIRILASDPGMLEPIETGGVRKTTGIIPRGSKTIR